MCLDGEEINPKVLQALGSDKMKVCTHKKMGYNYIIILVFCRKLTDILFIDIMRRSCVKSNMWFIAVCCSGD